MLVQVDQGHGSKEVETALGKGKVWRDISAAVKFVEETCPYVSGITLQLDGQRDGKGPGKQHS